MFYYSHVSENGERILSKREPSPRFHEGQDDNKGKKTLRDLYVCNCLKF